MADETQQTLEDLNVAQIGNQLFAPLVGGLATSQDETGYAHKTFKGLGTRLPLGRSLLTAGSFRGLVGETAETPASRRHNRSRGITTPPWPLSRLTETVDGVHQQLVDMGFYLGERIDRTALPQEVRTLMEAFSSPIVEYDAAGNAIHSRKFIPLDERPEDYALLLADAFSPKTLPRVTLTFAGIPPVTVDNVPIGPGGKSLAHTLFALGLIGEYLRRPTAEGEFIYAATHGALDKLPPIEKALYEHLAEELRKAGHKNPAQILHDSGCDIDRSALRESMENLLPYAAIYQAASDLRGSQDYFGKALGRIEKYVGKSAGDAACGDAYEYALLLEGMADYVIRKSGTEAHKAEALKTEFIREARAVLGQPGLSGRSGFALQELLQLPSAKPIVEAFVEAYSAEILLDRPTDDANRAWAVRQSSAWPREYGL